MIKPEKNTSNISLGTEYEINKNLIEKYEKELSNEIIEQKKKDINDFILNTKNKYYMLLCREKYDYTVFSLLHNDIDQMTNILVDECLQNRGIIKGLDITDNKDAFEIWISKDDESYCYYFFPYDAAIIEV